MKVVLSADGWDVYYRRVADTPSGPAVDSSQPLLRLGTVEQSARVVDGLTKRCWEGTDTTGRRYMADNKSLVMDEMARGNGFEPIRHDDTIPQLF